MSEPARNRFALDLDDLERQLRGAAQPPRYGQSVDPLVELTRIVGRDDPIKELFAPRANAVAPVTRQEPSFQQAQADAQPPMEVRGALDEFEALLRRTDGARPAAATQPVAGSPYVPAPRDDAPQSYHYDRPAPVHASVAEARDLDQHDTQANRYLQQDEDYAPAADDLNDEDMPDLEPRRSRKGLWTAAALVTVGIIGAGAAMTMRSSGSSTNGLPPTISADTAQIKVQPANPGGAEIPNQNKQIYERASDAPAAPSKVVSRDEQPVDVQQAARTLPPRVVLAGPGSTATTPVSGAPNPLSQAPETVDARIGALPAESGLGGAPAVPGLGEPRRVRTVSIRPDGTPAPAPGVNQIANAAPAVTGSAPARPVAAPAATPTVTASPPAPRPRPGATTAEPAKAQERIAAPATTPTATVRIASAAPAPAPAAPATAAIRSGVGDFTVQLGAPGSEAEARATYAALQRKYPGQLGGQAPIVRKTELAGGKTVFRLRVGPYSRDDATNVCTQLQAAGGQCFIAKN